MHYHLKPQSILDGINQDMGFILKLSVLGRENKLEAKMFIPLTAHHEYFMHPGNLTIINKTDCMISKNPKHSDTENNGRYKAIESIGDVTTFYNYKKNYKSNPSNAIVFDVEITF
mgnify:CR=1 FL=1